MDVSKTACTLIKDGALPRGATVCYDGYLNISCENLEVLFPQELSNVRGGVAAVVIFSIRDEQECFSWVVSTHGLVQSKIHRVVERGSPLG